MSVASFLGAGSNGGEPTSKGECMQKDHICKPAIQVWCRNRLKDSCEDCHYERLEPETLGNWELPPELPPLRELLALPARERLAFIYLVLYYRQVS